MNIDYLQPTLTDHGTVMVRTRGFSGSTHEPGGKAGASNTEQSNTVSETDPTTGSTLND
jgi:hypothetical protein